MDIHITGASQNTLKNLTLTLPTGCIIALMGPSGSGKSTLAKDTLFAESRRRFLDCLSPGARRLLARPEKPLVHSIEGLPPALCLEQHASPGRTRTILGSLTEALDYLRILYAAGGIPHDPETGERLTRLSPEEITLLLTALPEGTRLTLLSPLPPSFGKQPESDLLQLRKMGYLRLLIRGEMKDLDDLEQYSPDSEDNCELVIDRIITRPGNESRIADSVQAALRLCPDELRALIQPRDEAAHLQSFHTRYRNEETGFELPDLSPRMFSYCSPQGACPTCEGYGQIENRKGELSLCPACQGMRLNPAALAVTLIWDGEELNLGQLCEHPAGEILRRLEHLELPPALKPALTPAVDALRERLTCLTDLGLGYLSLSRPAYTLSGGELQRARLAGQIGGGLSGVLYILDEPTIGLHPREVNLLITALRRLKDKGNTILVVEHDPQLLAEADWLVEMGPGSGQQGGYILAEGTWQDFLLNSNSPTGAWLSGKRSLPATTPLNLENCTWATLCHAHARNLANIDFRFPLQTLTCLSGPGGSGKSTLVHECLLPALQGGKVEGADSLSRVILVDQSPLGRTARSTPATATGLLDVLRPLYAALPLARQRGYTPARFSLSCRGGRCERCGGTGQLQVDMNFLADLYTECDACHGQRYNRETLEVTWRGKSIAAALSQTVEDALEFFAPIPAAQAILQALYDLGLGYLPLDRSVTTLSGGEAQRVKLATYLGKARPRRGKAEQQHLLFILDEPSTGLHFSEVERLLQALYRLRDAGHTILCIEHHQGLLSRADYLVELGPGAGTDGGRITYEGPPQQQAARADRLT